MTGLMTMMDVHTSHISLEAGQFLQQQALCNTIPDLIVYEKGEYGWFIPVVDGRMTTNLPCLNEVIDAAKARGCDWIMLDCDGAEWPDLPTYEW